MRDLQTSPAMMAVDDNLFVSIGFQFAHARGDLSHWDMHCLLDVNMTMLVNFTTIEQQKVSLRVKQRLDRMHVDFNGRLVSWVVHPFQILLRWMAAVRGIGHNGVHHEPPALVIVLGDRQTRICSRIRKNSVLFAALNSHEFSYGDFSSAACLDQQDCITRTRWTASPDMAQPSNQTPREFAVDVVRTLREAGYEALWAGGCVRDQLLQRTPKDYDVATNARPDDIRRVFGRRRTLPIGAAFGVITVLGPKSAGQIEVATFRQDAEYSDGRHPDSVTFSTAEEDAQRRDFTINGLFYDPLDEKVIDYVGGQQDLEREAIRAIGDPYARIAEDKLRMLRAVRFAATFDFAIDDATLKAVQQQAGEIIVVSAERIAAELRRMLVHKNRRQAVTLLRETNLLQQILPESESVFGTVGRDAPWQRTLSILEHCGNVVFEQALAILLREVYLKSQGENSELVVGVLHRWKLSNEETKSTMWLLKYEGTVRQASKIPWPDLQRVLIADRIGPLLDYADAVAHVLNEGQGEIHFCREKLRLPPAELNPDALIDGEDLKRIGIPPGPAYKRLLHDTRDAQLNGFINDKDGAIEYARSLWDSTTTAD